MATAEEPEETLDIEIQLLLAEYNSLRQESLQAINHRIQVMNFGFTSLAVIIAGILSSKISHWILAPICIIFIPGAAKASVMILLGEYHRSQRAGSGVARIEREVRDRLGDEKLLSWETGLNAHKSHMRYPYTATGFFILSTGYLSAILGCYYASTVNLSSSWLIALAVIAGAAYAFVTEFLFVRFAQGKLRSIRTEAKEPSS